MPLVRPLHEVVLFLAIPFLNCADELVVTAFDLRQVNIRELTPLLREFSFELHPFPFDLIRVHEVSLAW